MVDIHTPSVHGSAAIGLLRKCSCILINHSSYVFKPGFGWHAPDWEVGMHVCGLLIMIWTPYDWLNGPHMIG